MKITEQQLRRAAEVLHAEGLQRGWFGTHYTKTFEQLEKTDSIGVEEFKDLVFRILEAAQ